TKLRIPALLSGILTMIALYSVNLRVLGRANVSLLRMATVYTPFETLGLAKNLAVASVGGVCALGIIILLAGVVLLFKAVRMVPQGYEWT
ncbi:MAG TPA: hypothetical protein PKE04_14685, partial [Clostridia bacterium]|nr:hypothetical protein [Clostridia bacterium]